MKGEWARLDIFLGRKKWNGRGEGKMSCSPASMTTLGPFFPRMRGSVDEDTAYPLGTLEEVPVCWAGGVAQPVLVGDFAGACLKSGQEKGHHN